MTQQVQQGHTTNNLINIVSFANKIEALQNKNDLARYLLYVLNNLLKGKFLSFVEENKEESILNVLYQIGESEAVNKANSIFNKELSVQLYKWVVSQKKVATLKLGRNEEFIFIPLVDHYQGKNIEHGMIVFCSGQARLTLSKDISTALNLMMKLSSYAMTKILIKQRFESIEDLKLKRNMELKLTAKIQKSMSPVMNNKKLLFEVLEDENSTFNGNFLWLGELNSDIMLVLMAQTVCDTNAGGKDIPSAMIAGYLIGEMNSLKTRAEISLKPKEVLNYLNTSLNSIFKDTSISVNAWYGVINISARKITFSNANHPAPYLIGSEQQVSNLISRDGKKYLPLGVNINSIYTEDSSFIPSGSRLVICTQSLIDHAASVGNYYDSAWFPHVLETLGTLSLTEMKNSLDNILLDNKNGTAPKRSRLALLLEIPQAV